jgi:energy-coupling factor transporter ATP-binding protein EcfA2
MAAEHAERSTARLLEIASHLRDGEQVVIQWQIGAWLPRSPVPPATKAEPRTVWNLPDWGTPVRDSEQVTAARKHQADHVFGAVGRIAVSGAHGARAASLVESAVGAYQLLRAPGVGVSRRRLPSWWVRSRFDSFRVSQIGPPVRVTADELAGLIGWPVGNPRLPGVRYSEAPKLPLDPRAVVTARRGDRVIGVSGFPSQSTDPAKRVVLRADDATKHLAITGPTGVGKSTLLARLILADITAGRGVVVFDPKGDLIPDLLARVPEQSRGRVVVLDPTSNSPVGFNPLQGSGGSAALGVDGILHVLQSTWAGSWGPRLGDVLHAGLLTLAITPGHSIAELPLLLTDRMFRRPIVAVAVQHDPLGLGTFWPWFDGLSDEMRAQVLAPVMNKLRAFLLRSELRATLGQPAPRFDFNSVFTHGYALLVRLPKGELGTEGAQLLGSLLMSHLWRLSLGRSAVPAANRRPVFFYLDEFQDFLRLPVDLADALVQARGLAVGLVLAHQHLDQLDRTVRSAFLANPGSRILFRLDHDDAAVMARRTRGDLSPDNLSGLAAFEAYATVMVDGEATRYGSLTTLPLARSTRNPAVLMSESAERWGVPGAETEARLRSLMEDTSTGSHRGPIGGRPAPGGSS